MARRNKRVGKRTSGKSSDERKRKRTAAITLAAWEESLRDHQLPQIKTRLAVIINKLKGGDHNRGTTNVILDRVTSMLNELTAPTGSHEATMRDHFRRISEIEPSVSPDGSFREISAGPNSMEPYANAVLIEFRQIHDMTWDIYKRMKGSLQPDPPKTTDPVPDQIVGNARDILKCLNDVSPKFLDDHMHIFGK